MNRIRISGVYGTRMGFKFHGQKYYETTLETKRTSGNVDEIKVLFSEVLAKKMEGHDRVLVSGEIQRRTVNRPNQKYESYVLANDVEPYDGEEDVNECTLTGYVIGATHFRELKKSVGTVCNFPIAVVRKGEMRNDIVNIVTWNKGADRAANLKPSQEVTIKGRIESRRYTKDDKDFTVLEIASYNLKTTKKG